MNGISLHTMSRAELETAVEWAAREGWNPGLDDAAAFFAADPEGFFAATQNGETIGTISAVRYGDAYGFVGFFIVKPEFRGHEVGWKLAEHALQFLGDRTIGIDGVLAKQEQYAKFFGFTFAYRNIRYGGAIAVESQPAANLVPLGQVPFEQIAAFDRRYFPAPRTAFLREWTSLPHAAGYAVMGDDGLRGYGVIRQCREGFKIGPLFVSDTEIAEPLFLALSAHAQGAPVFLDVPELNEAAKEMAARHEMKEVFATARMYRGAIPNLPVNEIFGVTTFELG